MFRNRRKSDGARSGLYGGCSKMSQWNCSCSKPCVCRAVCRHALLCNRILPRDSLPLQQCWIARRRHSRVAQYASLLIVVLRGRIGRILNQHSHLCPYHVTRSNVQLHEATFQHHTEQQKLMIGCTDCMRKLSLLFFGWPSYLVNTK